VGRALESDEQLREERSTTDQSLREERSVTDDLLGPDHDEQRVNAIVDDSRIEAGRVLRAVREDSDVQLEKQADGLPAMSEKLEQVAESLSKAAAGLTGVAEVLQGSSAELVSNIAKISDDLKGTAASPVVRPPTPPDLSGSLTEQLAEIAVGSRISRRHLRPNAGMRTRASARNGRSPTESSFTNSSRSKPTSDKSFETSAVPWRRSGRRPMSVLRTRGAIPTSPLNTSRGCWPRNGGTTRTRHNVRPHGMSSSASSAMICEGR
jgi:hypothetical protein